MANTQTLLAQLADQLEAAACTIRELAGGEPESTGTAKESAREDDLGYVTRQEWLDAALELHPMLGDRQAQVLLEVAKAHPEGVGTGPIWKAINYEQPNTYLALDALGRQGLVRKDDKAKPHKYHLGDALIRQVRNKRNKRSPEAAVLPHDG